MPALSASLRRELTMLTGPFLKFDPGKSRGRVGRVRLVRLDLVGKKLAAGGSLRRAARAAARRRLQRADSGCGRAIQRS